MLYLSRKIGESIVINGEIEITIAEVSGKTVKLACHIPEGQRVLRKELFLKIEEENKKAAEISVESLQKLQKMSK